MDKKMEVSDLYKYLSDNQRIMVGGFGLVGAPLSLIRELEQINVQGLTIISNNLGEVGKGLGKILLQGKIKKAIGSFFTSNPDVAKSYIEKKLDVELLPQGTLSEAIRSGGAGIGGFYIKTGVGTLLGEEKETREIQGETYLYQESLQADVALIRAKYADEMGNLVFHKTARNFNPIMATAAKFVIAEVDEIVPTGSLSPESIVVPHIFVDRLAISTLSIKDVKKDDYY